MSEPPKKKKKGVVERERRNEWMLKLRELKDDKFDADIVNDFVENQLKTFESPDLFADILQEILKEHGHASVPAFNGLLYLVLEKNFALKNLYEEAYALLKPSICYANNAHILLTQIDRALTSTHITKYMLAAFAKRLARLLVFAPVQSQMLILAVIKNLFASHKGVFEQLVNREKPKTLNSDPFDNDAPILECRAIESSLWELKALSNHWYVRVSDRSKFIFGNRPEQRTALTSDETWKAMERKFNEDNSVLGKPLVGGRLKILEDLISD